MLIVRNARHVTHVRVPFDPTTQTFTDGAIITLDPAGNASANPTYDGTVDIRFVWRGSDHAYVVEAQALTCVMPPALIKTDNIVMNGGNYEGSGGTAYAVGQQVYIINGQIDNNNPGGEPAVGYITELHPTEGALTVRIDI